jgi:hypothetical protein
MPDTCATWEPLYAIVKAFPFAPAWGQAVPAGEGTVTARHLPEALKATRRAAGRAKIRAAQAQQGQKAGPAQGRARD